MNSALQTLLSIIELATSVAQEYGAASNNPEVVAGAALAAKVEQIAQKALTAHQQITGQAIDLTKLQPITPLPS